MNKAIFILATVILFFTIGCEKNNDDEGNRIEFDDEVYSISWGSWSSGDYYKHEGLYSIDLRLLPSTMSFETKDSLIYLVGTETFMGFGLVSSTQTLEGSYSLPGEGENEPDAGQIEIALIVTWPSEDGYIFEKEGQLDITRSGDDYQISFMGVEEGGLTVRAYYKGTLIGFN